MTESVEKKRRRQPSVHHIWVLGVLAAGLGAFFVFGLNDYLSLDMLRTHRVGLSTWVAENGYWGVLAYMAFYVVAVTFSVPGGVLFTMTGGFLFGNVLGTTYAVISATIGASFIFLAANTSVGEYLRARAGPRLHRIEENFNENAFNYLLVLRIVPLFPFWIVNLTSAFLGIRFSTYFIATFIGIIPAGFIYATVGTGLGDILDSGAEFSPMSILTPKIIGGLCGIAAISLLPVFVKWFTHRNQPKTSPPAE